MKFIASYNGIEVLPFSNVSLPTSQILILLLPMPSCLTIFFTIQEDIEVLREKMTCQMVLSRHNEHQAPIVKEFLAKTVSCYPPEFLVLSFQPYLISSHRIN